MNDSPHQDAAWELEVGRFVMAFGDIEHSVTLCLSWLPKDSIGDACKTLPLGIRLSLLEAILSPSKHGLRRELFGVVRGVRTHLERRNLIAHNGLQIGVYKDGDRITFSQQIVSSRNHAKSINYAELVKLAKDVQVLARQLSNVALDLVHEERPDLLAG